MKTLQGYRSIFWGAFLIATLSGCQLSKSKINSVEAPLVSSTKKFNQTLISSAYEHTCRIMPDSSVQCWGTNNNGELGDGTQDDSPVPVVVAGITGAISISVGDDHACALINNGTIKCWGYNWYGELGDGTTNNSNVPVSVLEINSAISISAGTNCQTCALLADHSVKCWGNATIGNEDKVLVPTTVPGLNNVKQILAGYYQTCALISDGTIKCWGYNYSGQLGDGTFNDNFIPVQVKGISNAIAITTGSDEFNCALLSDHTVQCWGYNSGNIFRTNSSARSNVPVLVSGINNATSIATGGDFACAILSDQSVACWGDNSVGQHGDGSLDSLASNYSISKVAFLNSVSQLSAGNEFACAMLPDQSVNCWGSNSSGALGNNDYQNQRTPTPLAPTLPPPSQLYYDIDTELLYGVNYANTVYIYPSSEGGKISSCQIISGTLPYALTLNSNCTIEGPKNSNNALVGEYDLVIQASNTSGSTQSNLTIIYQDVSPSFSYNTPINLYQGQSAVKLLPNLTKGMHVSFTLYGTLPDGMSFDSVTGVISGAPTATASIGDYSVHVTAKNSATGGVTQYFTITVNAAGPVSVSYPAITVTQGKAMNSTKPTVTGGTVNSCALASGVVLPKGINLTASTCLLSGTLDAAAPLGTQSYAIDASTSNGTTNTSVSITVVAQLPVVTYPVVPALSQGTTIAPIVPTLSGGAITSCKQISTLPAGLTVSPTDCKITGPLSSTAPLGGPINYTIQASNSGGSVNAIVTLTIIEQAPTALTYPVAPDLTQGLLINPIIPVVSGGKISQCNLVSGTIPDGLSLSPTDCSITGTVKSTATLGTSTIIVQATNSTLVMVYGTVDLNVVAPLTAPVVSYSTSQTNFSRNQFMSLSITNTGGKISSCKSVTLPRGLTIDAQCTISGTPTDISNGYYSVTAYNAAAPNGVTATAHLVIR